MQTGSVADRITAAAHDRRRQLPLSTDQVVAEDLRLRGWRTTGGGPTFSAPDTTFTIQQHEDGLGDGILYGSVFWDLGYHNLGVTTPVTLPDGSTHTASLSSVALDANTKLVCFYADRFRATFMTGVYVQRVYDDGNGHVYWADPIRLFGSKPLDEPNGDTQMFVTLPRIQMVGNEIWVFALECSKFAGHERYHLCYFRSKDGVYWTRREYLAGASPDADNTLGIYRYDTATPFVVNDLASAYLEIEGNFVYLLSPESKFYTDATLRVGVDNPIKRLDLTKFVKTWRLSVSRAPSAGTASTVLANDTRAPITVGGVDDVLRRGARIRRYMGYRTSEGMEFVKVATEYVDDDNTLRTIGNKASSVTSRTAFKKLQVLKDDVNYEYPGPQQLLLSDFCDFTSLIPINGKFRIMNNARLWSGPIFDDDTYPENTTFVNFDRGTDGAVQTRFKQSVSWEDHYIGLPIAGQDEKHFWSFLYNRNNSGKFQFRQAIPHPRKRALRKMKYAPAAAESDEMDLHLGRWHWMHVQYWHGRVQGFYSTNHVNWTKMVDYTLPDDPSLAQNQLFWSDAGHKGISGCSTMTPSGPVGQPAASSTASHILADSGGRNAIALRVKTGPHKSYLRRIAAMLTHAEFPPDVVLKLLYDANGSGANPPDATDEENVVFAKRLKASEFDTDTLSAPQGAGVNVPGNIALTANSYFWIMIYPVKPLTGDQVWYWYGLNPSNNMYGLNRTRESSNGGASWHSLANQNDNLCAFIEVEYDEGTARFRALNAADGRMPYTMENLARQIAAKGDILEARVSNAPDSLELGDCVVEADVTLTGTAAVLLRGANGYKVELHPDTQSFKFYSAGSLICDIESLQYFEVDTPFALAIYHHKNAIYVYVNQCLATVCFILDEVRTNVTGFPTSEGAGTFENFRVPELYRVQDYFVLDSNQAPAEALERLTDKRGVNYFVDYDERLVISGFRDRQVADAYSATVIEQTDGTNDTEWVSEMDPEGERFARRWDPEHLDSDGRRYEHVDYTDAFTDEQAWQDATLELQRRRELSRLGSLSGPGVPTAELEDLIQDGAGEQWIIDSIQWQREGPAKFSQTLNVRQFVGDAEELAGITADTLVDDDDNTLTDDDSNTLTE